MRLQGHPDVARSPASLRADRRPRRFLHVVVATGARWVVVLGLGVPPTTRSDM